MILTWRFFRPIPAVIDLAGRIVFPGFIDTHIHTMDTLPLLNGVMLSPGQSAEEVLAIAAHAQLYPVKTQFGIGFSYHAPLVLMAPQLHSSTLSCLTVCLIIDEGGHAAGEFAGTCGGKHND